MMKFTRRCPMSDPSQPEPSNLRFLRILVTTLTAVMICGLVVIVGLLVIRFSSTPGPALPESIALPDGVQAVAITAAQDWYAVVTDDNRILVFSRTTGALRQTVQIDTVDQD